MNPEYAKGQLTSLQAGLRAIDTEAQAILFTPVDIPSVRSETVEAIASAWSAHGGSAAFVVPRYEGRHGHPVLFRSELAAEFLALPDTGQAREVVHRYVSRTVYVDVLDAGILRDIDDPRAYAELVDAQTERS